MNKIELLAPAGNLSKLKIAFLYGADAVYVGGEQFSLRQAADNFSDDEMCEGIGFAHDMGKKVYVAINIVPRSNELVKISEYADKLYNMGADGVIVSDMGTFDTIHKSAPKLPIHISTQANTVNYQTANMWYKMGASRIVLARELSVEQIREIRENLPSECELEAFVHGAMCVSYSGRCLLSNFLANREGNRGECAQPCRWKYYLMEEKRPGEYMPVYQNDTGTFIFNSKDLCMIKHIPLLAECGIKSFKIEGRVKSEYYVATVVKAYREAIDAYYEGKDFDDRWLDDVCKVSHREYSEGFYFKHPEQIYTYGSYVRNYDIVGMVLECNNGVATVEQRNRFYKGDTVEFVPPKGEFFTQQVTFMKNQDDEDIDVAPHPRMIIKIPVSKNVCKDTIIRRKVDDKDE